MNNLKYKVWNKIYKKWLQEGEYHIVCKSDGVAELVADDIFEAVLFTGIKDRNGKEIYEGDIVSCEISGRDKEYTKYYKVIFTDKDVSSCGCCTPAFHGSGFVSVDNEGEKGFLNNECEIIGNIYENNELLNLNN